MRCYTCSKKLNRQTLASRCYWLCPKCKGALFPFSSLENLPAANAVMSHVKTLTKNVQFSKRPCPVCWKRLRLVYSGGGVTELDVCDRCRLVWFDREEFDTAGSGSFGTRLPEAAPSIPNPRRSARLAQAEAQAPFLDAEPIQSENLFHALTSLPLEEADPPVASRLLALPLILSTCVALSLFVDKSVSNLGFRAWEPWRHFGLTWITATFVHAGLKHLLGNAYFIWLYGDNVEEVLGPAGLLELFFWGAIGGHAAALLFGAHHTTYVGASGAIMALAVFYTLSFPKVRFSYFVPLSPFHITRFRVPIGVVTLIYLGLDFWGAKQQMHGQGNVSHLSHLGGILMGTLYWLLMDRPGSRRSRLPSRH
jgi:membrane associated rhomboid family serine protease/Zn-finger nucleic acid-binding protein